MLKTLTDLNYPILSRSHSKKLKKLLTTVFLLLFAQKVTLESCKMGP